MQGAQNVVTFEKVLHLVAFLAEQSFKSFSFSFSEKSELYFFSFNQSHWRWN